MKGSYLGEFEELVLLTVGILYDDAYGLAITDELEKQTGRKVMMSSVHKSLVRLEQKDFLYSEMSEPSAARGGRKKKLYFLTDTGKEAVKHAYELRNKMWNQVPSVVWKLTV